MRGAARGFHDEAASATAIGVELHRCQRRHVRDGTAPAPPCKVNRRPASRGVDKGMNQSPSRSGVAIADPWLVLLSHRCLQLGLRSITRRKFRVTTDSKHTFPVAPNRLQRNFTVAGPTSMTSISSNRTTRESVYF